MKKPLFGNERVYWCRKDNLLEPFFDRVEACHCHRTNHHGLSRVILEDVDHVEVFHVEL